jgi:hypothetical protein
MHAIVRYIGATSSPAVLPPDGNARTIDCKVSGVIWTRNVVHNARADGALTDCCRCQLRAGHGQVYSMSRTVWEQLSPFVHLVQLSPCFRLRQLWLAGKCGMESHLQLEVAPLHASIHVQHA